MQYIRTEYILIHLKCNKIRPSLSCSPWALRAWFLNWQTEKYKGFLFYLLRKVEKSCLKNDKKSNPLVVLVVPAIMILLRVELVQLWSFLISGSKSVRFLNKYRHAQRKSLHYLDRGPFTNYASMYGPKNVWAGLFLAGNQGNHQNFDASFNKL